MPCLQGLLLDVLWIDSLPTRVLQILLLNQHPHRCQPACAALQVLLLDEITVDMDVVGRLDLLQFFL